LRFETDKAESILWTGRLIVSNGPKITFVGLLAVFFVVQLLALVGRPFSNQIGVDTFLAAVGVLNSLALLILSGTRFYITDRRVARTTNLLAWSKTLQLPIQSITDSKSFKVRDRGYAVFVAKTPPRKIVLGPFKDDPDKVRAFAIH
jgi:hypothetical protein